jgi:dihydrofolate synthase/folylpolyglutamate synthase
MDSSPPLPQTPAEALAYFAALSPSTIRLGLDRVREALASLKNPQANYPALHVAGTNGKGSTCAFAASCLRAQGYRVGLYTSPHLESVNERIQINSEPIRDGVFGDAILEVLAAMPPGLDLTYFEFGTVVALHHFAQERVDVAVLETGLGGRLDATNTGRSAVTAITPVSFDHMEYLGHTLAAIAGEKAGIIKPRVPVVVGRQEPEALAVIEKAAREQGAPLKLLGRDFDFEPEGNGKWTYRGMRTRVPNLWPGLRGPHQVQNAAVALACLELLEDAGLAITRENARAGLASTEWPGRLEEFEGKPKVLLDGAHNPDGVATLLKALDALYPGRELHLVFGVVGDKDYRPMVRALFPRCKAVYLTPVPSPRTLDPAKLVDEAKKLCPQVEVFTKATDALTAARKAPAEALVLAAGSLFLIGELRSSLREPR